MCSIHNRMSSIIAEGFRSGIHNIFLNVNQILGFDGPQGNYICFNTKQIFYLIGHGYKIQTHWSGYFYSNINITFLSGFTSCIRAEYTKL